MKCKHCKGRGWDENFNQVCPCCHGVGATGYTQELLDRILYHAADNLTRVVSPTAEDVIDTLANVMKQWGATDMDDEIHDQCLATLAAPYIAAATQTILEMAITNKAIKGTSAAVRFRTLKTLEILQPPADPDVR